MTETTTTKNITTVEELTTLSGTEKVFVNSGGTIKQIAPENAKFGGAAVIYYANQVSTAATASTTLSLYKDTAFSDPVTVQEFFEAMMSGPVWICGDGCIAISTWYAVDSSNNLTINPTDAVFVQATMAGISNVYIEIGTKPASGK